MVFHQLDASHEVGCGPAGELDKATVVHRSSTIVEFGRIGRDVRAHDGQRATPTLLDQVFEGTDVKKIKSGEGFIENEKFWIMEGCYGETDAFLHSIRTRCKRLMGERFAVPVSQGFGPTFGERIEPIQLQSIGDEIVSTDPAR